MIQDTPNRDELVNSLNEAGFDFTNDLFQLAMAELDEHDNQDDPDPIVKQMVLQKYGIVPARLTEEERKLCAK